MSNKRKDRTIPERLYNANVLSNGALFDVPPVDVVVAKIEKNSREEHASK